MNSGIISDSSLSGGLDLQATLESGQTYLWDRDDGNDYVDSGLSGGTSWYSAIIDGNVIRVRQIGGKLEWESNAEVEGTIRRVLGLNDDLNEIMKENLKDPLVDAAYTKYKGMRIVRDPFFACVVSFICSSQMRVERIFRMQQKLRREYGEKIRFEGKEYYEYPKPSKLASLKESNLRKMGFGYRAPYVIETAKILEKNEMCTSYILEDYEQNRSKLTELKGVGEKVADCICLFSIGHLEAVPLDTWIRSTIKIHYPSCYHKSYQDTSKSIRNKFGPYAGYVQTYIFHYLRHEAGMTGNIESIDKRNK